MHLIVGFLTSPKFKLKKLSILPRFYFHDALEQLNTNFHTNFRFKRVLGFVIEYAWISKLLRDAAFTWRSRELLCRKFCYLNSSCIRKSIPLMFMNFSKNKFTLLQQNSVWQVSWKKGTLLWHIPTQFRLPEILEILPEIISKLRQFCDFEKGIKRNSIWIFRNQSKYPWHHCILTLWLANQHRGIEVVIAILSWS